MFNEVTAAVTYFSSQIENAASSKYQDDSFGPSPSPSPTTSAVDLHASSTSAFASRLAAILTSSYSSRWHESDPERGSAHRAIVRFGASANQLDRVLRQAADESGLGSEELARRLLKSMGYGSDKFVMWVDPGCVSIRIGERGELREIWGRLPAHIAGSTAAMSVGSDPFAPLVDDTASAAPFVSPMKKSRAIQIIHPDARRAASPAPIVPDTPLQGLEPPISLTAPTPNAKADEDPDSTPTIDTNSLFAPSPLSPLDCTSTDVFMSPAASPSDSSTSSAVSPSGASDLFARPSSRSSSTSGSSTTSYSHGSCDSRSSSVGSRTTMASVISGPKVVDSPGRNGPFAYPFNSDPSGYFASHPHSSFPRALNTSSPVNGPARSVPSSPTKPRAGRRGRHAPNYSVSSVLSTSTTASSNASTKPKPAGVVEHSNGKVGVLGGGVLLGVRSPASGPPTPATPATTPSEAGQASVGSFDEGSARGARRGEKRSRGGNKGRGPVGTTPGVIAASQNLWKAQAGPVPPLA